MTTSDFFNLIALFFVPLKISLASFSDDGFIFQLAIMIFFIEIYYILFIAFLANRLWNNRRKVRK